MGDSRDQKPLWTTPLGILTGITGLLIIGGLIGGLATAAITKASKSDLNEIGFTSYRRGVTSYRQGQYQEALNYYQQALVIYREVGDRAGEGAILNNIGRVYAALRQYEQALKNYQQALVVYRNVQDRAREESTLDNISEIGITSYRRGVTSYRQGQHQ